MTGFEELVDGWSPGVALDFLKEFEPGRVWDIGDPDG